MKRNEAIKKVLEKYKDFKNLVLNIENKLSSNNKGMYHEDITQDLYIKIQMEIDSIQDDSSRLEKFVKERIEKPLFYYTAIKNMIINKHKKENPNRLIDIDKIKKSDYEKIMIEDVFYERKERDQQIEKYVKSWNWFDQKLFNLYAYEFKSKPLSMSKETGLSVSKITRTVRKCKMKIKKKFSNE